MQAGDDKAEEVVENPNLESMKRDTPKHGVQFTRVGLQILLDHADENSVVEHATLQVLWREIAGCPDVSDDESVDVRHGKVTTLPRSTSTLVDEEVYSMEKQLACLAIAKTTLERHGALNNDFATYFISVSEIWGSRGSVAWNRL